MYVWDAWMVHHAGVTHAFHLMRPRRNQGIDVERLPLGHATTTDLTNWQEQPTVMPPGPASSLDDMQHWTGDAVVHDGQLFLFYTARSSREDGLVQRTMLATTRDFRDWDRMKVAVMEADPRWYLADRVAERSYTVSWRDPKIVRDSQTGVWYAFLAADEVDRPFAQRGCIARARSRNLVDWEVLPPAFAPGRYACLEVPDVFEMDGRWYMTALTGTIYGNSRDAMPDPNVTHGTIFAVSDTLDGLFEEPPDNLVLGSATMDATSLRSVEVGGVRYAYYFMAERNGAEDSGRPTLGVLTTPKEVVLDESQRLVLKAGAPIDAHFPRLADVRIEKLAEPDASLGLGRWRWRADRLEVSCAFGWTVRCMPEILQSFDLTVRIRLSSCAAAGVLFHAEPFVAHPAPHERQSALLMMLDAESDSVVLTRLRDFVTISRRRMAIRQDHEYEVRIICMDEFIELYVEGVLLLSTVRYELPEGLAGLFVERGAAFFSDLEVRASVDSTPTTRGGTLGPSEHGGATVGL